MPSMPRMGNACPEVTAARLLVSYLATKATFINKIFDCVDDLLTE